MIKKLLVWGLCFSVFNNIIAQPLEGKWVGKNENCGSGEMWLSKKLVQQ